MITKNYPNFESTLPEGEGKANRSDQAIVFLFIGGGHYRPWLEQEARRRGLDNMLFRPYQPREHLRASLSVPDVHLISLLPSLEGLIVPSKFYGILAAGRPVLFIGDPQGEIGRLIHQADCGTTVGVGKSQALAEQIVRLYQSPALQAQWGQHARHLLIERFDRKKAIRAWDRLLKRIAKDSCP